MALAAAVVWDVQTGGNDGNGGGFKTGATGTNRSTQTTAFATLTTLSVVNATTTKVTVSLTDYTVVAADVGNVLQVTGGSATAGFYEITGVDTVANTWTVDKSLGTAAQTVVGSMGGCLASLGMAASGAVAGNIIYQKNGTYSISSTSTNVATGCVGSTAASNVTVIGHSGTRTFTNGGTRPINAWNVSTATLIQRSNWLWVNVAFDGNGQTAAKLASTAVIFLACTFTNFNTATTGGAVFCACLATTNSAAVFAGNGAVGSYLEAYANTATPINTLAYAAHVLTYGNTGASTDGIFFNNNQNLGDHIVAVSNGRDGIRSAAIQAVLLNCHAQSNAAAGYSNQGSNSVLTLLACGDFGNATRSTAAAGVIQDVGPIVLAGDAFTSVAGNDYSLNALASAGAALRAAGFASFLSNIFPRGLTTSREDVGAAQSISVGGFPQVFE